MGEQGVTLVAALGVAVFIVLVVWLLNGPSRRRVADLERRLNESRDQLIKRSAGRIPPEHNGVSSRSELDVSTENLSTSPVMDDRPDADVIELRPRGRDQAVDNLKHELSVTRDELLRWRAMSDDFERRWRHEMVTVERLEASIDELQATEVEARRAIDDIKSRLVTMSPTESSSTDVTPTESSSTDVTPTDVAVRETNQNEASRSDSEVIDLRDRRSDLEDRLTQLAAEIDDVRRDLASEDE